MTLIDVVQNDKLYDLKFTLQDSASTVIDLTNVTTIKLNVQQANSSALKFSGTMALDGAATLGKVKYTVQANDFDVPGKHKAEIELTYSGTGQITTFPDIIINVKPQIPISNV